jgi:hypothetical protein
MSLLLTVDLALGFTSLGHRAVFSTRKLSFAYDQPALQKTNLNSSPNAWRFLPL